MTAEQAAQRLVQPATAADLPNGAYFERGVPKAPAGPAADDELARGLWVRTAELLNLPER
ncbi:hypothetical protein [Amycolatopsis sp. NPDC051903]|uniref:hypothetical protein n=1 Tax=Amycolatopsis sp. NPDC051903 TaxID=3363936 RepID=UPI0037A2A55F